MDDPAFQTKPPPAAPHRTTLVVYLAMLFLFIGVNTEIVAPYFMAITMGAVLTALLKPFYRWMRKKGIGPHWCALVSVIGVLFLVIGPLSFFGFAAVKQAVMLGQSLSSNDSISVQTILEKLASVPLVSRWIGDINALEIQLRNTVQALGRVGTSAALGFLAHIPGQILQVVFALVTCFFLLIDGKRLQRWADNKIPLDRDVRTQMYKSFQDSAVSVIQATLIVAIVQSAIIAVLFLALGVPLTFLAAGTTFIFAWIPVLGSTPVWLSGAIYLYSVGSITKAVIMIIGGLLVGVVDNVIRPLVLRGRGAMHPLVSLIAIFGGLQVFGIFGVFFGPILMAVLLGLLEVWPSVAQRFGLFGDDGKWESVSVESPVGLKRASTEEVSAAEIKRKADKK